MGGFPNSEVFMSNRSYNARAHVAEPMLSSAARTRVVIAAGEPLAESRWTPARAACSIGPRMRRG